MKNRLFRITFLVSSLLLLLPALGRADDVKVADRQERLQLEVVRDRKQRTKGGDFDDQLDRITLTVKVQNLESKKEFPGLKATIWMLGESQVEKGMLKVMARESFDFKLGVGKEAGSFEKTTKEVTAAWDNTGAVFGYRYQGWVLAIQDADGKVIAWKATRANWETDLPKFFPLQADVVVDRKLAVVDNPPVQ